MVKASKLAVTAGTTTINIQGNALKTTLKLCNQTPDKDVSGVYAIAATQDLRPHFGNPGLVHDENWNLLGN